LNSHGVEYLVVGGHAVAYHGHPLLTSISGVDFESAWQSRVETFIGDQPANVLGWEDLLRNKRASGRQKDLADLEKLLAIAKRAG
jgi:hypothetical protein